MIELFLILCILASVEPILKVYTILFVKKKGL
jgi:hypothetical protein